MSGFKVVCIWRECKRVPEWVSRTLESHGIEFVEQNCKSSEQVLELAADADVIWVMGSGRLIPAGMLPMCTRCGAIICSGSGTDSVPVSAATKLGIIVANTPDATAIPVAEHAIALLLAVCRLIPFHDQKLRAGAWSRLDPVPLIIHNKTAGLVGFGRISRGVAKRLTPFGMRLLAYDPFVDDNEMAAVGVEPADWTGLLSESDFVSVHVPLLESTHHLIGEAELKQMKPTSVLINTCRGPVVDTAALATALKEGWIAAAGLDVLENEPAAADDPLIGLPNVVITPHIGSYYDGLFDEFWRLSMETVIDLFQKKWPVSYVNPEVTPRWDLK